MTRLRIPELFNDVPAGDYEVRYIMPAAGVLQIAPSMHSLGQKDKPDWHSLQSHPGVQVECANYRNWFGIDAIPLDELRGWRCQACTAQA
jgi:hypothetical protein